VALARFDLRKSVPAGRTQPDDVIAQRRGRDEFLCRR
jgi:hypothetical protein